VRIETKIDGYNNLREKLDNTVKTNDVQDEKLITLDKSISKIEDNQKWIWRTLTGAIIVIVLNLFFELIKRM
jgi:hypothetical protein